MTGGHGAIPRAGKNGLDAAEWAVNGPVESVNGLLEEKVKYTPLLNEGSQFVF